MGVADGGDAFDEFQTPHHPPWQRLSILAQVQLYQTSGGLLRVELTGGLTSIVLVHLPTIQDLPIPSDVTLMTPGSTAPLGAALTVPLV